MRNDVEGAFACVRAFWVTGTALASVPGLSPLWLAGSAVVPLDQPAAKVAVHFLEPEAPDSALAWGFFNTIFEQKEYGEPYVVEKLAREMMEKDPKLKEEFERKIENDPKFAASPYARLSFFYDHSPWYAANRVGQYPVGRLTKLDGVPLGK